MTILDLEQLASVTGGAGCGMQQPQPQQQGAEQAPEAGAAPGGGNFLAGLQQFLGFFQSPGFQQVLGGLQSMLGSIGGQQQQQQQPQSAEA